MASSMRMIQQPAAMPYSLAGVGESVAEGSSSSGDRAPASAQASQGITVTTTLEVAPTTPPRSTAAREMHSSCARSFVQSLAGDTPERRPATGVSHTIRLPAIPTVSSIDLTGPGHPTIERPITRPKTAPSPSAPSDERAVQPKLPPFMQSRRWAKMCEAPGPKTSGHGRAVSEEDRPMTLREASFEQQRAAWRHMLPVARVEATEEAESVVEASGLCRTVSMPTWQLIRVTRGIRGRSEPSNSLLHRLTPQKGSKSSKHSRRQSVEKSAPRISRASQIGRKRAMSDLRKQASSRKRDTSSHVVYLDEISPVGAIGRGQSPIPSLHDPQKDKRFSEECEALLTNKDFEKDFLSTSAWPSRSAPSQSSRPQDSDDRNTSTAASAAQAISAPHQASEIALHSQDMPVVAQPPVRTSSKGAARLATMVQMTKPACIPILNGFKDGAFVAPEDASGQSTPQNASPRPRHSRIPFRMASVTSTASEASRSPRPVKSTDTLTLIEAQVRTTPQSSLPRRPKKAVVPKAVSSKQIGPSGTPPERPLPDLPPDNGSVLSRTPPRSSIISGNRRDRPVPTSPVKDVLQSIAIDEAPSETPQHSLASSPSVKEMKREHDYVQTTSDQVPDTPTLVKRQPSMPSVRTGKTHFFRHDKTQFRADRMKEIRRRIKADLERQNRISEERDSDELNAQDGTTQPSSKPAPTPDHDIKPQPSLDQLDQFPAVPPSRPASRTSHHSGPPRRTDSRGHGHVRQSSKASSRMSQRAVAARPASRPVLGTSQIRVLVDTDPLTGHFRAGAMTPEQGSLHDGQSVDGSPRRAAFKGVRSTALPNRIDEDEKVNTQAPRAKASMRSIRSHASAISARHSVAGSRQSSRRRRPSADTPTGSLVDSSDDENLLLSVRKDGKRRLRRRWNSNDIRTVQGLYQDLDQSYETLIRQEQELQKQREEIQMMVRVLAPVSRANGLRTATFSAERQEFVDAGISLDDVRSTRAPSAASTMRPVPRAHTPSLATAPSPARTNASSAKGTEKRASKSSSRARLDAASAALDSVIKERPVSDLSTASATTDVSRGSRSSRDNSAAEGSMTDPFEYDVGPAKAAVAIKKGAKHGMAIHGHKLSGTLSLAQSSSGEGGSSRPQSRSASEMLSPMPRSPAPLHNPPPVAKVIPRGTLSEEEEDDRESVLLRSTMPGLGVELGKGMFRSASGLSSRSKDSHAQNRLSVNHVFTRTEEMDRMLSVISALD